MIPLPKPVMNMNDVLEFVVEYFGADPNGRRSTCIVSDRPCCLYRGPGKKQCAFGLFTKPEAYDHNWENRGAYDILGIYGKDVLRAEVAEIDVWQFWTNIQQLHDVEAHWDLEAGGLTPAGHKKVAQIRLTHNIEPSLPGEPDVPSA